MHWLSSCRAALLPPHLPTIMVASSSAASATSVGEDENEAPELAATDPVHILDEEDEVAVQGLDNSQKVQATSEIGEEQCYLCHRLWSKNNLINSGCKAYPKWRCRPCHNSVRQLERAARSQSNFEQFSEQRRLFPQRFAELVLTLRVAGDAEPKAPEGSWVGGLPKGTKRGEMYAATRHVLKQLYSLKGVEEFQKVVFLSERQFRAHYKLHEDYSAAEAASKWSSRQPES